MDSYIRFFIRASVIALLWGFFSYRIIKALITGMIEGNSIKRAARTHYNRSSQPYSYWGMVLLYLFFMILFLGAALK